MSLFHKLEQDFCPACLRVIENDSRRYLQFTGGLSFGKVRTTVSWRNSSPRMRALRESLAARTFRCIFATNSRGLTVSPQSYFVRIRRARTETDEADPSRVISRFMDVMLKTSMEQEVAGLVLNPWGQSFFLTKELIVMLFQALAECPSGLGDQA